MKRMDLYLGRTVLSATLLAWLVVEQIAVRNPGRKRADVVPTEIVTGDPLAVPAGAALGIIAPGTTAP